MPLPALPTDWEPTRLTLQKYAQAITAAPRAGATADPRWAHVSLHPIRTPAGVEAFSTATVPLADGHTLLSTFDVLAGGIVVVAGEDRRTFTLADGPSPRSIGSTIEELAAAHGSTIEVDADRYADDDAQPYDEQAALAWFANTAWVTTVFDTLNANLEGEVSGPHIWPHGFDLATEWFGSKVVDDDGTNGQVAVGFYPAGDPYFYVNPWPFDERWAAESLPHGATWNTDGWCGAKLEASALTGDDDRQVILDIAEFVHALARPQFS